MKKSDYITLAVIACILAAIFIFVDSRCAPKPMDVVSVIMECKKCGDKGMSSHITFNEKKEPISVECR